MRKTVSIALVMRILGSGIWLLYTVAMARFLPKADFGSLFYSINVALIAAPVATLGFETATIKHASQYWVNNKTELFAGLLRQARLMALTGGTIFLAILLLGAVLNVKSPVTDGFVPAVLTGLAITLAAVMGIHRDTLRAADKIEFAFLGLSIIRTSVPLILAMVLAGLGLLSARSAMITFVIALAVALVIEKWAIGRLKLPSRQRLPAQDRRNHLSIARRTWLGDMAHVVLLRAPGVLVGLLTDLETLALFLAAERIANLGQFITDAVRTAIAPSLSRACEKGTPASRTQSELRRISMMMLQSGVVDAAFLILAGWPVLWLLGSGFTEAYPFVLLAAVVQMGWAITGPSALFMNMIGMELSRTIWTVGFASLLCAGILIFTTSGNVANALIVQAVVVWVLNISNVMRINRKTGFRIGLWALLSPADPSPREH